MHKLHVLISCVLCSNACLQELCRDSTTVSAAPSFLYNVLLDHLLSPRLSSRYLPTPGLPIQDLTEDGPAG